MTGPSFARQSHLSEKEEVEGDHPGKIADYLRRRLLRADQTGVLQTFRAQGVQSPRSPFWRSKRPAQLGGTEANGSCHDVVVTTDGVPLPQEMPQNKGFGLESTFRTVILLLMGRPAPVRHRPGWSSQMIHRTTDFTESRCCLQNSR